MGPLLGEPYPDRPFYPNDDRIVSIAMHLTVDAELARTAKVVGVYWRHVALGIPEPGKLVGTPQTPGRKVGRMIDYIVQAAKAADAEGRAVRLSDLFRTFREQFPDPPVGSTVDSFSAMLNFHTINMKSRFNRQQSEDAQMWLREPLFKRVSRGTYMLLSTSEIEAFQRACATGDPIVRTEEYDMDELVRRFAAG